VVDERHALCWGEVDGILNRAVNALLDLGLNADRQRVAIFAENSIETLLGHLAGILAGISTVPVNFHLTAPELVYILEDSGAAVMLVGPETADVALEAVGVHPGVQVIGWRCSARPGLTLWKDFLANGSPKGPPTHLRPRPYLHYTSGTTGRPKGVEAPPSMFAGGADIAEHLAQIRTTFADPRSRGLIVSPMYHGAGLNFVRTVAAGGSVVILGRFDAEKTLRAIQDHRTTTTTMVPTHFARLLALREDVRARYDVSSLQTVLHTGASCPIDIKRRMIDWWGPVLLEVYGATEAGATNRITSEEWLAHPGSVGKTISPFELVVIGENGDRLGAGEVGQLYFRDPSGRGIVYNRDPEKTAAAHLEPGVFTLGDIGYFDDEDFLYITDRSSDMVISGGTNIYPAEAEQVLLKHPGVLDAVCIGAPHQDLGEELRALVVSQSGAHLSADELINFCRRHLAGYKCPKAIDFVQDVGRNAMGKVNKRLLRAPYWPSARTIA
jgi:acyl-CoA synthetase (AMP-forming)/AMP-acid ligase II